MNLIDQNGVIIIYEVDYQPSNRFGDSSVLDVVNTTDRYIFLRNLQESVQYNITVRAFTRVGPGPFSPHVLNITQVARKWCFESNFTKCLYLKINQVCYYCLVSPVKHIKHQRALNKDFRDE